MRSITDDMTNTEIIVEALRRAAVDPDVRTRTIEIRVGDLADAIEAATFPGIGWFIPATETNVERTHKRYMDMLYPELAAIGPDVIVGDYERAIEADRARPEGAVRVRVEGGGQVATIHEETEDGRCRNIEPGVGWFIPAGSR